jgi:hypothetical protein
VCCSQEWDIPILIKEITDSAMKVVESSWFVGGHFPACLRQLCLVVAARTPIDLAKITDRNKVLRATRCASKDETSPQRPMRQQSIERVTHLRVRDRRREQPARGAERQDSLVSSDTNTVAFRGAVLVDVVLVLNARNIGRMCPMSDIN